MISGSKTDVVFAQLRVYYHSKVAKMTSKHTFRRKNVHLGSPLQLLNRVWSAPFGTGLATKYEPLTPRPTPSDRHLTAQRIAKKMQFSRCGSGPMPGGLPAHRRRDQQAEYLPRARREGFRAKPARGGAGGAISCAAVKTHELCSISEQRSRLKTPQTPLESVANPLNGCAMGRRARARRRIRFGRV